MRERDKYGPCVWGSGSRHRQLQAALPIALLSYTCQIVPEAGRPRRALSWPACPMGGNTTKMAEGVAEMHVFHLWRFSAHRNPHSKKAEAGFRFDVDVLPSSTQALGDTRAGIMALSGERRMGISGCAGPIRGFSHSGRIQGRLCAWMTVNLAISIDLVASALRG